jgi:hypothetical protein
MHPQFIEDILLFIQRTRIKIEFEFGKLALFCCFLCGCFFLSNIHGIATTTLEAMNEELNKNKHQ